MSLILNNLRATLRLLCLLVWLAVTIVIVTLIYWSGADRLRSRVANYCYRCGALIFGLRIHLEGVIALDRPLLLVPNHTSYLDIVTLGSLVELAFTPKSEIRRWPVIGFLCVLADCVFIERRAAHMHAAAAEMRTKLSRGKVLCIFGEGTTTDGIHIKPFKSGFLNLAIEEKLTVQPISVAYTHFGNRPISPANREEVAWVGDATLVQHVWHVLSMPNVRIYVQAHPAIPAGTYTDRKLLTHACEAAVKQGVAKLMEAHGVTY
jgi:1-acyl-sn-glycerol-3-phosphate acyltransferase